MLYFHASQLDLFYFFIYSLHVPVLSWSIPSCWSVSTKQALCEMVTLGIFCVGEHKITQSPSSFSVPMCLALFVLLLSASTLSLWFCLPGWTVHPCMNPFLPEVKFVFLNFNSPVMSCIWVPQFLPNNYFKTIFYTCCLFNEKYLYSIITSVRKHASNHNGIRGMLQMWNLQPKWLSVPFMVQ